MTVYINIMLTFDTLLTYLDTEQCKLTNLYNQSNIILDDNVYMKYMSTKSDNTFSLPESVIKINKIFSDYYYVDTHNTNSFIHSILYCLDNNFVMDLNKSSYINNFRKELCYDLEEKNLYRKFNYVKLRKFKKDLMQKNLLDIHKNIDEYIEQYIIDYFGINVYIFLTNEEDNMVNVLNILSHNDTDECNPYKPTLLLFNKNSIYYPILRKDGSGIFKYSENELINILYENYVISKKVINIKKTIKVKKNMIDDMTENTNEEINNNTNKKINKEIKDNIGDDKSKISNNVEIDVKNIKLKSIKNMLLNELQDLAIRFDIDIKKKSLKSDKMLPKTKTELYNELHNIIKS
jgi:hypothetical protein